MVQVDLAVAVVIGSSFTALVRLPWPVAALRPEYSTVGKPAYGCTTYLPLPGSQPVAASISQVNAFVSDWLTPLIAVIFGTADGTFGSLSFTVRTSQFNYGEN